MRDFNKIRNSLQGHFDQHLQIESVIPQFLRTDCKVEMANWFLYMVTCFDNSIYTGISTDPTRREAEHNNKKGSKSLYGRLPVKLVYIEKQKDRVSAAKREREIKSWSHKQKLFLINRANLDQA